MLVLHCYPSPARASRLLRFSHCGLPYPGPGRLHSTDLLPPSPPASSGFRHASCPPDGASTAPPHPTHPPRLPTSLTHVTHPPPHLPPSLPHPTHPPNYPTSLTHPPHSLHSPTSLTHLTNPTNCPNNTTHPQQPSPTTLPSYNTHMPRKSR